MSDTTLRHEGQVAGGSTPTPLGDAPLAAPAPAQVPTASAPLLPPRPLDGAPAPTQRGSDAFDHLDGGPIAAAPPDPTALPTLPTLPAPGAAPTPAPTPAPAAEPAFVAPTEPGPDAPALPTLPTVAPAAAGAATPDSDEEGASADDAEPVHPMAHLMPAKTAPSEASRRAAEQRAQKKAKARKIKIAVAIGAIVVTAVAGPPLFRWVANAVNEAGNTSVDEPAD